jgi:hypothetical protein
MIFLSEYQNYQPTKSVKAKTSPFSSFDRTCSMIEEVFREEKSSKRETFF